jgi:hypothetical protein
LEGGGPSAAAAAFGAAATPSSLFMGFMCCGLGERKKKEISHKPLEISTFPPNLQMCCALGDREKRKK